MPGFKFADAELIGIPTVVVVGRGLSDGVIEVRDVFAGEKQELPVAEVVPTTVAKVRAACPEPDTTILFLCRSGQRSASAAKAMTDAGYANCYNIAEGFEGDKDDAGHRGSKNGWKVRGLAWKQG